MVILFNILRNCQFVSKVAESLYDTAGNFEGSGLPKSLTALVTVVSILAIHWHMLFREMFIKILCLLKS
jgi:hypothetical protein